MISLNIEAVWLIGSRFVLAYFLSHNTIHFTSQTLFILPAEQPHPPSPDQPAGGHRRAAPFLNPVRGRPGRLGCAGLLHLPWPSTPTLAAATTPAAVGSKLAMVNSDDDDEEGENLALVRSIREDLHRLNKAPPAYPPPPSDALGAAITCCAPSGRGRHPIRTRIRTISICSSPSSATSRTTTPLSPRRSASFSSGFGIGNCYSYGRVENWLVGFYVVPNHHLAVNFVLDRHLKL